ncbi:MAG TPA: hypothetical protein VGV34_08605, partial [Solirubrobacterales bacterium]|nr:hypothetical protein [Solirubrobacterales bacterium]
PNPLARAATALEAKTGLPGWAALPTAISGGSLLVALVGMYWDISLHIDNGRDAGPLANPAHYLILIGLFGVMFAGLVAVSLPHEKPSDVAVRIRPGWYAPLGGVLMVGCAAFSLAGFPLDDFWHRLFGQDVTLWGPTHLMLIGGASLATIASWVLFVEGTARRGPTVRRVPFVKLRQAALAGGLLVGLSTFQAEFDFGVPQFRLLFHPVLLMLAAGIALVLARVRIGRGGALVAVVAYLAIRGLVTLLVGPVFGQTLPHMPLYLAEALVVEAVALFACTQRRPLRFGLFAGIGIGTVGLAAERGWSHLWMPLPWPESAFPEVAIVGLAAAIAGSTIGAWIGTHLSPIPPKRSPQLRRAAVCSAAVLAALVAYGLYTPTQEGVSAQVALKEVGGPAGREVEATVRLNPPDAAADAEWFDVTAWQGGGLVVAPLERIGPGLYRSTEPIPVHDNWKAMIRLHDESSLTALPIYLPRDEAIPVGETPAPAQFTRAFSDEHQLLQREAKGGPAVLVALAYATVAAIAFSLLVLLAWALHRLAVGLRPSPRGRRMKLPGVFGFQ